MAVSKDFKKLVRNAEKQGWRVKITSKGRYKLYAPDGVNIVTASGTIADRRALANILADLKRYGYRE